MRLRFSYRTVILFLLLCFASTGYYLYWEHDTQEQENPEVAEQALSEDEPHPPPGLDEFRAQLRAERVDVDVAVPAIYSLIIILPLAALIYLFASLMQSLAQIPQKQRGDSKADLSKARAIRVKREKEALLDEWRPDA